MGKAGSSSLRRRVLGWAVALMVSVASLAWTIAWVRTHSFTRPYSQASLREQWSANGTLDALRDWANRVLSSHRWASDAGSRLPSLSGPLHVNSVRPLHDAEKTIIAIELELGGADNHHGLIIGVRPGANAIVWPVRAQWAEDVWWYDEVPKMDERSARSLQAPWWLPSFQSRTN